MVRNGSGTVSTSVAFNPTLRTARASRSMTFRSARVSAYWKPGTRRKSHAMPHSSMNAAIRSMASRWPAAASRAPAVPKREISTE